MFDWQVHILRRVVGVPAVCIWQSAIRRCTYARQHRVQVALVSDYTILDLHIPNDLLVVDSVITLVTMFYLFRSKTGFNQQ